MQLQGHLRLTTLGDLLGAIYREGLSGTLELTEEKGPAAGRVHAVHLVRGQIVQVDSCSTVSRLGDLLVRQGWLEPDAVPRLVEESKLSRVPLGQRLLESGMIPSDAVLAALREQIHSRLEAVFQLHDARVAFRLVRRRRRELDVSKPLAPEDYLVGRPRARDRARTHGKLTSSVDDAASRRRDLLLLGLGPDADSAAIRCAFRRLARSLHPDRYPTAPQEQQETLRRRFADVSAAYHRLAG